MVTFLRSNGLTLALLGLFLCSLVGQGWSGFLTDQNDRIRHGEAAVSILAYLQSGAFLSSVFENWESEFLQMWAYVMLTAYLMQRGSPESWDLDSEALRIEILRWIATSPPRPGRCARAVWFFASIPIPWD